VHTSPAFALSLSNLTEAGTAYTPKQTSELAGMAKAEGLGVHVDGARLANAAAATGASPADLTWRAGADAASFGLTKTGAATAEMAILFGDLADRHGALEARRKRAGHMPPKARFAAAEALAMLDGNLWLTLAAQANAAAQRLAEALGGVEGAEILHPAEGNLVFARLPEAAIARAQARGARFFARQGGARLVCSWNTTDAEIEALVAALG
jgi:threonine aldolase